MLKFTLVVINKNISNKNNKYNINNISKNYLTKQKSHSLNKKQ